MLDYIGPYLPPGWRLPIRYYGWAFSSDVEPEADQLFALCRNFRCAIDVGANHGYYSYKMAQRFERVCAFEANSKIDYDLRHFRKQNICLYPYGLSDAKRSTDLYVPVRNGVPYIGWASLTNRDLTFADTFDTVGVELQRLDDQPFVHEMPIDLIKVDVEGHELEVLRGGLETIRRDKPVLILEDNQEQHEAIRNLLENLGYRGITFAELTGLPKPSPNIIYFPL